MKSLGIATAILAATIALASCKNRKEEPIPGPKAAHPPAGSVQSPSTTPPPASPESARDRGGRRHGAPGISFFQGTIEEAFSTCGKCTAMFWHETLGEVLER
jgi:hypothetical protein